MGVRRSLLALMLLMAACSGSDADATSTTTTSTTGPSTTSTTTSTTTLTTTTEPGPVDLAITPPLGNRSRLTPGTIYRHDYWLVPIFLEFQEPGWVVSVRERLMLFDNEQREPVVGGQIALVTDSPSVIVGALDAEDSTSGRTELRKTSLGGLPAETFDILITEPDIGEQLRAQFGCTGPTLVERTVDDVELVNLPGCAWNRIWLIEVEGGTIVVTAADLTVYNENPSKLPESFPELDAIEPVLAELEAAITIGG